MEVGERLSTGDTDNLGYLPVERDASVGGFCGVGGSGEVCEYSIDAPHFEHVLCVDGPDVLVEVNDSVREILTQRPSQ